MRQLVLVAAAATAAVGIVTALLYVRHRRKRLTIKALYLYPIKGCRGISVDQANVTRRGLKHDRTMMLVNEDCKFISQRSHPRMVLLQTKLEEGHHEGRALLRVSAPSEDGGPDLVVEMPHDYDNEEEEEFLMGRGKQTSYLQVSVWGTACLAYEVSPEASAFFSKHLSRGEKTENLRLVRMASQNVRPCKLTDKGQTGFSDQYPFLLCSVASMADLARRLPLGAAHVNLENFRANIIVDGCTAWEEDSWKAVTFTASSGDSVAMQVVSHCSRCKVPTNDIERGCFDENDEPSRTMKTFRQGSHLGLTGKAERELYFGVNLDNGSCNTGHLSVGFAVTST